jgi:hypothetical protein
MAPAWPQQIQQVKRTAARVIGVSSVIPFEREAGVIIADI